MYPLSVQRRTIGLSFSPERMASLLVWAPFANSLKVSVNNQIAVHLKELEYGYWKLENVGIIPGERYHLLLDGKTLADPASLFQPAGVLGPSMAIDISAYQWNDREWRGIPQEELIIYELHTGTFTDEGTFDAILSKLDYLADLGINAIELMPVAQFSGSRNWGYDGVFPFAVQNSYGGAEGLQKFVDICHQRGFAVILDVVYNHLGPEGNCLLQYGPYFTDKYKTPWGQAINFDDEWSDGVRHYYIENALMWLRDFHMDGLRLDAIHAIKDFGAKHILQELKERTDELNALDLRNHFLIGESDLNDVRFITPLEFGGYNLNAIWNDEFHHALHALVTKESNGYYADFGDVQKVAKTYTDVFVYDGLYSPHRKRTFGNRTAGFPGYKFVVFTQNHDQVGNRMAGDRLTRLLDFEMLKVLAGAMFISPFIPMLFMGEEFAEEHPFQYFTSHSDEELIRLVREGRKNEFKAFMNDGEVPDPQSTDTFNASKLNWTEWSAKQKKMFVFYKELIHLRKTHQVLRSLDRKDISASVFENRKTIVFVHKYQGFILLAVINFDDDLFVFNYSSYSSKKLILLLNSAEERWGGSQEKKINPEHSEMIVPPGSIVVLSDVSSFVINNVY